MGGVLTIDRMAKSDRKPGRPPKASKITEVTLHVDIPDWLKDKCDAASNREGRHLKTVVARLLKIGFGLDPDIEGPPADDADAGK